MKQALIIHYDHYANAVVALLIFRLDSRGYIKISDFGVSHLFEDEESSVVSASSDLITSSLDTRQTERLSRRESDAAMMMKSMANMGKLSKTEG